MRTYPYAVVMLMLAIVVAGMPTRADAQDAPEPKRDFIRVMTLPFVVEGDDGKYEGWGDAVFSLMIESRLARVKPICEYDGSDAFLRIAAAKLDPFATDGKRLARVVAEGRIADCIVYGRLIPKDGRIAVRVALFDVRSGRAAVLCDETMAEKGILGLDAILARRLLDELKLDAKDLDAKRSTDSLEAFMHFARAAAAARRNAILHDDSDMTLMQRSLDEYRQAVASDERFIEGLVFAAQARLTIEILGDRSAEQIGETIAWLRRAEKLNAKHPKIQGLLGLAFRLRGDPEQAVGCLRRALVVTPNNASRHNNLAEALIEMGDVDGAEAEFRKALELQPDAAAGHANLAMVLKERERYDEARKEALEAVRLQPGNAGARLVLGWVLLRQGDLDGAEKAFAKAVELRADSARGWYALGLVALQGDRPEEAEKRFREALKIHPDLPEAIAALGELRLRAGKTDEAVKLYRKASSLVPDDPGPVNRILYAYLLDEDYDKAWKFVLEKRDKPPREVFMPQLLDRLEKMSGRKLPAPPDDEAEDDD